MCTYSAIPINEQSDTIYDDAAVHPLAQQLFKYNTQVNNITLIFIYNGIYVRATCFDLVGHPQALQEKDPRVV